MKSDLKRKTTYNVFFYLKFFKKICPHTKVLHNFMLSQKWLFNKLRIQNCLLFGNNTKMTSKKVAKYLLGKRDTTEVFKLYELRYLLLKIYPLIHNLFYNPQLDSQSKMQKLSFSSHKTAETVKKRQQLFHKKLSKQYFSFILKHKNTPPQILFASVTPTFSNIISNAAQICNMPWHKNRWLCGSITAAISYPSDKLAWQYLQDLTQTEIFQAASTQWGRNKENEEKIKEKIKHYNRSRWPSLIVIPDISNNLMILKEAQKIGLPVIGLVNSNCVAEIDYPIFAQDATLQSIHFFCHFLALLIAKETFFLQHKRYTLQNFLQKKNQTKILKERNSETILAKKKPSFEQKKNRRLYLNKKFQKVKKTWKKPFFFKIIRPWDKRFSRRYFSALKMKESHPLWLSKYRPWKRKFKKKATFGNALRKGGIRNVIFNSKLNKKKRVRINVRNMGQISYLKFIKLIKSVSLKGKKFFKTSKKKLNDFRKQFLSRIVIKKLFRHEYSKKYFQKNKLTSREKKKLQQILRNFVWVSKMTEPLIIYNRFFTKRFNFPDTPYYFKHSLQQWAQHFKWRNHRNLIKDLLWIKLKTKKQKKEEQDRENQFILKKRFWPLKNLKKKIPPQKKWKKWVKQNR